MIAGVVKKALSRKTPWQLLQARWANRTVVVELLKDIPKLGDAGDLVVVKPGHMRNHLYPKKEAIYAPYHAKPTPKKKAMRQVVRKSREERILEQLPSVVDRLTTRELEFRWPLKKGESVDAPITSDIICRFIRERMRIDLSPTLLDMPVPLKQIGAHEIPLNFSFRGNTDLTLKVKIVDQSDAEQEST